MSRPDLSYSIMKLSGENSSPSIKSFQVYLFHHPHITLMYKSDKHTSPSLSGYSFKGYAEIINPQKYPELKIYTNANLARDLSSRCSVSSHVQENNSTSIGWGVHKQPVPENCTNISETTAILKGVKRTLELRHFLESMGEGSNKLNPVMGDN